MSKYPEEIIKAAEELIEKHSDFADGITSTPEETGYHASFVNSNY